MEKNSTFFLYTHGTCKIIRKEGKVEILILFHPNFPFDVIIIKRYIAVKTVISAKKKQ